MRLICGRYLAMLTTSIVMLMIDSTASELVTAADATRVRPRAADLTIDPRRAVASNENVGMGREQEVVAAESGYFACEADARRDGSRCVLGAQKAMHVGSKSARLQRSKRMSRHSKKKRAVPVVMMTCGRSHEIWRS